MPNDFGPKDIDAIATDLYTEAKRLAAARYVGGDDDATASDHVECLAIIALRVMEHRVDQASATVKKLEEEVAALRAERARITSSTKDLPVHRRHGRNSTHGN